MKLDKQIRWQLHWHLSCQLYRKLDEGPLDELQEQLYWRLREELDDELCEQLYLQLEKETEK